MILVMAIFWFAELQVRYIKPDRIFY